MPCRLALPLLILPFVACATGDARPTATVRDSSGIAIIENLPVDSAAAVWWHLDPSPVIDIGMLDGPEAQTLFRVVDAVRLSDGGVVVANSGTSEIRWYDATGEWLRSTGRQGGGPGEYQRIADVIPLRGDSLAVVDGPSARVTLLDPAGAFVRDISDTDMRVTRVHRLPDGGWVASASAQFRPETIENGMQRPDVVYVAVGSGDAAAVDTLASFPGSESYLNVGQTNGQITSIEITRAVPFVRSTTVVVRDDAIYVGTQDAAEIRVYGSDGTLTRIVRTGAALLPVTEALVEDYVERRVAAAPPERQSDVREGLLRLPHGAFVPPYGTLQVDRSGNLWVEDYDGVTDAPHWTVYDPDGVRLARIALPADFTVYEIGADWILGRELDELEIEHVRVYPLNRGG